MNGPAPLGRMGDHAAAVVGRPVAVEVLKDKPGRRRTARVRGPGGAVIVKAFATDRAPVVAARVGGLAGGPPEPGVPAVLAVAPDDRLVVLAEVPGRPLSAAVDAGDLDAGRRAGAALGAWHRWWAGRPPPALRAHPVERELEILRARADRSDAAIGIAVGRALAAGDGFLTAPWPCTTAVHRDLYEDQIVVDAATGRIGLIDLDDAAAGPPELDLGNLLAHLHLRALQRGRPTAGAGAALLAGYRGAGGPLDDERLEQARRLSELRLACIHAEPRLVAAR